MRPLVTDAPTTAVHPSRSAPLSFHACYTFNDHLNLSTTNRRQTPPESRARGGQSESDALSERTREIPSALLSFWNHRISIDQSICWNLQSGVSSSLLLFALREVIAVFRGPGWRAVASVCKNKNKAISSKYSSAVKSCQGQTCGRLLPRQNSISVSGCVTGEHSQRNNAGNSTGQVKVQIEVFTLNFC